jgi:hypothetical protein
MRQHSSILPSLFAAFVGLAALVGSAVGQTPISGLSSYPDGGDPLDPQAVTACNVRPQLGVVYRNSEAEPYLAVNPTNANNMIAGWHQDRWSTGGAQGLGLAYTFDGGATWSQVNLPFTLCSGSVPGAVGDYERASDPWISFGPDGTAYYMSLSIDNSRNRNALLMARSLDGGVTWSQPTVIERASGRDPVLRSVFNDKNSLTADPSQAGVVYATWTVFRTGNTALMFARSNDGGATWGAARPVGSYEAVAPAELVIFRQGAQIVVLPDGTLVDAFFRILFNQKTLQVTYEQAIFRSSDGGRRWDKADTRVSVFSSRSAEDPELRIPVRDAGELPDIAVNPSSGDLYMVWQDDLEPNGSVDVAIARSSDGGYTWSTPVKVNTASTAQAFLPAVAVNVAGTVGVLFYDFRNDVSGDEALSTDVYLARFNADLSQRTEQRLTATSFDMRQSVIVGARGYFPGDYVGLDTAGTDFVAAFTITNNLGLPVGFPQNNSVASVDANDRQSIVFRRITP